MDEVALLAARVPWLQELARKAPRGAKVLTGEDWSTGDAVPFTFPLDPKLPARPQVERIYVDAKRMARGRPTSMARLEATRAEIAALTAIEEALAAEGADEAALSERFGAEFGKEVRRREVRVLSREKKPPYRTFLCSGEVRALVGRDARRNDETTTHFAKPWHLWLHARGVPGSHVIGALARGTDPTPDLLVDCAHLAAHFSSAANEPIVDVSYTERRFVRKPRKSAPGSVVMDREKVLPLRIEKDRLERLLGCEIFEEAST